MTALLPPDDELLRQAADGDVEAFTSLYRRRQGAVYRFALRMSGSHSIAEDVTQEVFLALINNPRKYDPRRGPLEAWLIGIARKHVLRALEKTRAEAPVEETASAHDPAADLARSDTIDAVRAAVLSLPVHYREVVVLCDLNEMSYAETAAVLGAAEGTVRSRLHRARAMLLEKLSASSAAGSPAESRIKRCFA